MYGVISEEQKSFLYSFREKARVQEYVPAKLTFFFFPPLPFETDPDLPLKLLLTTLDTLTLTRFFPVVLLQMEF